jgi:hypothetical protein
LHEAVLAEQNNIIQQMQQCSLSDADAHTRLVMALQMTSAVNRNLWRQIQDGAEAAEQFRIRGSRID